MPSANGGNRPFVVRNRVVEDRTLTTEATAGAVTYTAAQLLAGFIRRDPNGAARSDVTPTAKQLLAAMVKAKAGSSFEFIIVNTADASEIITLTAGTGITLSGTMTIEWKKGRKFLAYVTNADAGSEAITIYNVSEEDIVPVSYVGQTTEAATDRVFFIANRAYQVVAIRQVHSVAAGGASKLQVTKDTGTNAPGAGNDLLTNNTNTGFDLNATANTVQTGTLTATAADLLLAAGDRLALDFANTIQSTAGLCVTVELMPV